MALAPEQRVQREGAGPEVDNLARTEQGDGAYRERRGDRVVAHMRHDAVHRRGLLQDRPRGADERGALCRRPRDQVVHLHERIASRSRRSSEIVASNARGFSVALRRTKSATTTAQPKKKSATPIVAARRFASLT